MREGERTPLHGRSCPMHQEYIARMCVLCVFIHAIEGHHRNAGPGCVVAAYWSRVSAVIGLPSPHAPGAVFLFPPD